MAYLLLKDIFPQNAVDLGLLNKHGITSILYSYFRKKEKLLYTLSDFIGCMSEGNKNYLLQHNPFLKKEKVEINRNSIKLRQILTNTNKDAILKKYNIEKGNTIYIYGGNLGRPQGIDFLCKCIYETEKLQNVMNLIVGNGTEFEKTKKFISTNNIKKTKLISFLPKNEFEELLSVSDVGLIFLDNRFTIPNYPSRLLSYLQASLPIIMSSDSITIEFIFEFIKRLFFSELLTEII